MGGLPLFRGSNHWPALPAIVLRTPSGVFLTGSRDSHGTANFEQLELEIFCKPGEDPKWSNIGVVSVARYQMDRIRLQKRMPIAEVKAYIAGRIKF
ncbi:hypothetical protein [Paenibacillus sp. GCM10027626]|uniref:hypothetical protein n=1 Tax=Paenibacillus sp. GCM10027626 TaxID=3273411 RepID=UPI00362B5DDC